MNRNDYRQIAGAIATVRDEFPKDSDTTEALNGVSVALADVLGKDNPYFNRRLFLEAAGALPKPDNGNQGNTGL